MMQPRNKQMFTPKEVAETLRVTRTTIYRWADAGLIQVVRLPNGHIRISEDEIERIREAA